MKRLAAVAALVLSGGLAAVGTTAAAAPTSTSTTVHLDPAPTSVDHPPSCELPERDPAPAAAGPGVTVISFTILPAGC